MDNFFEVLKRCPLFHGIMEKDLSAMLHCLGAQTFRYDRGNIILEEGMPAKYVGIVLSGAVQIVQIDYFGNRSIVTKIGPAELFGESFACAGIVSIPVDVIAAERTDIILINCLKIIHSCSNSCKFHQQMIYNLLKIVSEKNLIFHQKITVTSKRSTKEKLITYLLLQAKKQGCNSFEIPYNRQELADYLEVDRSGLSVEIGKLCRQGIIETDRKKFKIIGNI